jgi:CBS domain-containing protein
MIGMKQGYLAKKAADLADKDIIALDEMALVAEAAKAMRRLGVMSILVSTQGGKSYAGIVTEKDILYRVVAENKGPFKTALREIMSTPLITIDGEALVKDAVELMRMKLIRRLPVTRDGRIIGILTLRSITGNNLDRAIELAEVDLLGDRTFAGVRCPYCESEFPDKSELSKHIDRLHLGSGLLEGDIRQW